MQSINSFFRKRYFRILQYVKYQEYQDRIVFLHIPKTAGSSVNHIFKSFFGHSGSRNVTMINELNDFRKCVLNEKIEKANKSLYISGHFGYDVLKEIQNIDFSFTFLRDPIDRIESCYKFLYAHKNPNFRIPKMSFDEFINSTDEQILRLIKNGQARQIAKSTILDKTNILNYKDIIKLAINNIDRFDFVGLTKSYSEDILYISKKTKVPIDNNLRSKNSSDYHQRKSRKTPIMNNLSAKTKDKLKQYTELDYALYDHIASKRQ